MNRVSLVLCCTFICLILTGCQNADSKSKAMEVVVEGGGQFPEFLVGKWKSDAHGWEFNFEPDGSISSAVNTMGRATIKPGQITRLKMKMDGKGIFEPGTWTVLYSPATRELTVQIDIKNFYMEIGKGNIEGKLTDIFVGKVAEDNKFWPVTWTKFSEITAHTPDFPNFDLSEDPVYGSSRNIVFEKVDSK